MKPPLKDYFHMTTRERNGTLLLLLICFFFWGFPRYYQLIWEPEPPDYEKFAAFLARWESLEAAAAFQDPEREVNRTEGREPGRSIRKQQEASRPAAVVDTLFHFDPNRLEEDGLLRLGLPPRVVRNMLKYREKGGVFRDKEDLRRIYGMTEMDFERIEPYLEIPAPAERKPSRDTALRVDVNLASPEEWAHLPGIGPVLSRRIVRFREKLGGFVQLQQVRETYGLPDSTFRKIEPRLVLSPLRSGLPLNEGTAELLAAHPYLNMRQARAIVAYRSNHGPIRSADELAAVGVLDDTTLQKIVPYLDFSEGPPDG